MGISAIRCEGLYAEVKESGAGKGYRSSSDFNATDVVAAAGMIALVSMASGCINLTEKNVMNALVKDGDLKGHVDAELKATKAGDSTAFNSESGDRYNVMFKGMGPDGKANFDILRDNKEFKHFAIGNYEKPDTYEKMLNATGKIMAGESTDSVASLKFEGTRRWEMVAYAYINGNEVDLKLVDVFR